MSTRTPRSLTGNDLVLSHFSLERTHDLEDRISSAGSAGFAGIGLFAGQWTGLSADAWSHARLREALDEASICLAEIEVLSHWGRSAPTHDDLEFEGVVWGLVDAFESRYVQAIGSYEGSIHDAARRFGALCDRAAQHGAVVGLEFLPFTNIADASDALRIVEEADRPNGGVCVDIWHHIRGADDLALIHAIPCELITGVQVSDGPRRPPTARADFDYKDDCLRTRVPPGTGEFDVTGFVDLLRAKAVDVPWSLEVCNDSAWGRPAHDHVHAIAGAMRTVLAAAVT